jgi:hypothetical protein
MLLVLISLGTLPTRIVFSYRLSMLRTNRYTFDFQRSSSFPIEQQELLVSLTRHDLAVIYIRYFDFFD